MAEKQLLTEIDAAVRELRSFLIIFAKSDILPQGPTNFYANFKTFEGQSACVELTTRGWRIVSDEFDCMDENRRGEHLPVQHFETMGQLLNEISPGYRERFAESLGKALRNLQEGE